MPSQQFTRSGTINSEEEARAMLVNMIVKMNLTITTGEVDAQLPSIASDLEGEGMGAQQFADWLYGAFGFSTEEVDPSVQLDKAAADSKEAYPVTLPTPSRGA